MAKTSEGDLDPNGSYRDAMKALIGTRFGAVWKAVPVAVEGVDPEGVHDVRVASRRLRAAMDVAAGCFPDTWYRPLHRVAKSITTELGEVRDRDVLIEFLVEERNHATPNERAGIDRLIARVTRERDAAREHMLRFLDNLESAGVAKETERRFGREAGAPSTSQSEGV